MKVDFRRLTWENYPSTETPINADNLNRLEEGVAGLYSDVAEIEEDLSGGVGEYVTDWLNEHVDPVGSAVVVDNTLSITGAAADAKKTGDELTSLKEDISHIGGLSEDIKQAMLQIAEKVAYIDEDGQDYYDALYNALYPPADLVSISAVYTQTKTVYITDDLDKLKSDLVVTAHMSDSTTRTVTAYTLSGTLTVGTSTITVSYSGKTTTFSVTVSESPWVFESGKTINYESGLIESNADRTASSPIPIDNPTTEHTVTCTVDGTAVNFALRIYDENGLHSTTSFATTNTIGINAYKAFAIVIQQAVASTSQIVVTVDNVSYVGTFGTITQFTNTVYTNIRLSGIDVTTGEVVENQARAVTDLISIVVGGTNGVQYKFTAPTGYYIKVLEYTDTGFIANSYIGSLNSNTITGYVRIQANANVLVNTCTRFRVLFKKSDNSNFTSADLQALTLNNQGIVDYVFTEVNS